jgi:hypothetical protein
MCWLPEQGRAHVALPPKHERRHLQSRATRQSTLALEQCGGDAGAGLCVSRAGLRVPGKESAGLRRRRLGSSRTVGQVVWFFICVVFANKLSKAKPRLSRARRNDVYREVSPTKPTDLMEVLGRGRPVQEFRVHWIGCSGSDGLTD